MHLIKKGVNSMKRKLIPIVILSFILWISCENEMQVSEQNLLGMWKEVDSDNKKANEPNGILISEMKSGLYVEDIIIVKNNREFVCLSDGCFIELKQDKSKEQRLKFTCLSGELEHQVNLTSNKLIIGKRRFKKYSN